MKLKSCRVCGSEFEARSNVAFCSDKCRKEKRQADKTKTYYKHHKANREKANNKNALKSKENVARVKEWRKNNPEKSNALRKNRRIRETLSNQFAVYGLPYEMYCGYTKRPKRRIAEHKHYGKCVDEWFIIGVFNTEHEAQECERQQHKIGWNGGKTKFNYEVIEYDKELILAE